MMELKVVLDFACCFCKEPVSVTVKCEGKDLDQAARTVVAVHVPCPTCGAVSKLCFEPNGTLRSVSPSVGTRGLPEPSLN